MLSQLRLLREHHDETADVDFVGASDKEHAPLPTMLQVVVYGYCLWETNMIIEAPKVSRKLLYMCAHQSHGGQEEMSNEFPFLLLQVYGMCMYSPPDSHLSAKKLVLP